MSATIYEHGLLSIVAPVSGHDGRTRAAVVLQTADSAAALVQSFDADALDGLAAAVLKARLAVRALAAGSDQ